MKNVGERFSLATTPPVLRALFDEGVFACSTCGALVPDSHLGTHNDWHNVTEPEIVHPHEIPTSGPRCSRCGAFTTYTRVEGLNGHLKGLCMKCEDEVRTAMKDHSI